MIERKRRTQNSERRTENLGVLRCAFTVLRSAFLLPFLSVLVNAALTITSPAPGSTLTGPTTFQVDTGGDPNVVAVEYFLNGQTFSGRLATPYEFDWNTVEVWNTNAVITARAYDVNGNDIADSAPQTYLVINTTQPFTNGSTPGLLVLQAPADLSQPLSGTVNFNINNTFNPNVFGGVAESCGIDGTAITAIGNPFLANVDTTLYPNGTHTLYCMAYNYTKVQGYIYLAMQYWTFTIDNPTSGPGAPSGTPTPQIRMNYSNVYLVPGESVTLTASMITNTGQMLPLSPVTFSEADPLNIAANPWFFRQHPVTPSPGSPAPSQIQLVAVSTGMTWYQASYLETNGSTSTAITRIEVDPQHALPHFSKGGDFLNSYTPGQSLFVRTPFGSMPGSLEDPMGPQEVADGINTFEFGGPGPDIGGISVPNPGENQSFNDWLTGAGPQYKGWADILNTYDVSVHFHGRRHGTPAVGILGHRLR